MPTASELAGIQPPQNIDGISYLPILLGKQQPVHEYLFWKSSEGGKGTVVAVRYGKWKGIRKDYDRPMELYDLDSDLGAQYNVADQYPEVTARIERIMN